MSTDAPAPNVGELLGRCLRGVGARRVFGEPIPGLERVAVDDPDLARLLADADGRSGSGPGVAFSPGQTLRLSSRPGGGDEPFVLSDAEGLAAAVATWTVGAVHASREYRLDLDLGSPAPADVEPLAFDGDPEMYALSPSLASLPAMVIAGPGVVREGMVPALQAFAAEAGVGVLNTWGAKGVFRWDSPHHFGTAGLQARDFELAGVGDVELIIAVGLDEDEAPRSEWELAPTLEAEPASLPSLAFGWPEPQLVPERPPLYRELSAALGPGYESPEVPLHPARAAADLAAVRPTGGLVVADPGPAGLWVARAYPTTEPGSVVVPATRADGFAVAAALVAALDGRPAVAVTHEPVSERSREVLELFGSLGCSGVLEVWGDGPAYRTAEDHRLRLQAALRSAKLEVVPVPVDFSHTRTLVEVAGPVLAWGGGA